MSGDDMERVRFFGLPERKKRLRGRVGWKRERVVVISAEDMLLVVFFYVDVKTGRLMVWMYTWE